MDLALSIAKSGLEAQHDNIEIISNNLANSGTTGYKKSRAEFQDLPYQVITPPGSPSSQQTNVSSGLVLGTGTKVVGNTKVYSDGGIIPDSNPKHIAIQGRGFLQVQLPNGGGFAYTRDGNLQTNQQGQLTLANGFVIQPPITLTQGWTNLSIGQDGTVSVALPGSPTAQQVGQIQLADFINPDGLQPIGQNLYLESSASGAATVGQPDNNGLGMIVQNALEGSNVNVVEEMVNLIEAQRSFEVTSKAVSAVDSMMDYLERQV